MQKNSIVTKFCNLALGRPVIMPHSHRRSQYEARRRQLPAIASSLPPPLAIASLFLLLNPL